MSRNAASQVSATDEDLKRLRECVVWALEHPNCSDTDLRVAKEAMKRIQEICRLEPWRRHEVDEDE